MAPTCLQATTLTNMDIVLRLPESERPGALTVLRAYCAAFNQSFRVVPFLYECNPNVSSHSLYYHVNGRSLGVLARRALVQYYIK